MRSGAGTEGNGPEQGLVLRFYKKLRVILAVLLLVLLFHIVDASEVFSALSNIELIYVFYLIVVSLVLILLSCLKWQLFIRAGGHDVRLLTLMNYYTMSYFFNMFFPSFLGGDVARSIQLGRHMQSQKVAFAATFVERATGFLSMTFLGALFVAVGAQATDGVEAAILFVAFVTHLAALFCFSERLSNLSFSLIVRLLCVFNLARLAEKSDRIFRQVVTETAFVRNDAGLFFKALLYSFVFHFFAVVNTYICALAVGWNGADFGGLCIVVPLVLLVGIVPVTPSGIGIQEGAFVYFLERIGATAAQGLGVSLVLRAKNVVIALIGGILWFAHRSPNQDK